MAQTETTVTAGVIDWYRSSVSPADMKKLYERSDLKGFAQAGGFLGVLIALGAAALYSAHHFPWPITVLLVALYGTCFAFMPAAVHEVGHYTVFKTKALSTVFVHIFAFLGWQNHHMFEHSHVRHHRSTLHPPDDLEVVLPMKTNAWAAIRQNGIISPLGFRYAVLYNYRLARGRFLGEWENKICPETSPEKRRRVVRWARIVLAGHILIFAASIALKVWLLPVLVTFGAFYCSWLVFLVGTTQHIGLTDKTSDFRFCCRTVKVSPIVGFLYWHMNYHLEHHMYVGVPCYNLARLRSLIEADLPPAKGLAETWREIDETLKKQQDEPGYTYKPQLPPTAMQPAME